MGRSSINIQAQSLETLLEHFEMVGVSVVGSRDSNHGNVVCLLIEGDAVPDAYQSIAHVKRTHTTEGCVITYSFQAVQ